MSSLFLDAVQCKNKGRAPVWLMRQAGRSLPEYRAFREHHSLEELFHTPTLAAEITLLPVELLGVDAAILFSDILMIAEVFGFEVRFVEGKGPVLEPALETPEQIENLSAKKVKSVLACVAETIRLVKKMSSIPLIGFCGGPFTVASYLIEGGSSKKELSKTKSFLFSHPESFHSLLEKLTDATIDYLKMQIEAGVQALQIFDSWANTLSTPHFNTFCLLYLQKIVEAIKPSGVPLILFCRGSSFFADELVSLHPSAISFDWHKDLSELRKSVPRNIAVQGNLDPHLLKAPLPTIRTQVHNLLSSMRNDPGFILNLGHGVLPDTPVEAVKCFVNAAKDFS